MKEDRTFKTLAFQLNCLIICVNKILMAGYTYLEKL